MFLKRQISELTFSPAKKRRVICFFVLFAVVVGVLFLFFPPFFTYDSYDYLDLTLRPRVGDAHPLGFGLLLRFLFLVGRPVGIAPDSMLVLWNCFCLSCAVWFCLSRVGVTGRRPPFPILKARVLLQALATVVLVALVFPAWAFIGNSFWAECTIILQIMALCWFVQGSERYSFMRLSLVAAVLAIWSYETKYSALVYFAALLTVALVSRIPFARLKISKAWAVKLVIAGVVSFAAVKGTNLGLGLFLPKAEGQLYITNLVLRNSMTCTLRCEADLFEKTCSTTEGRTLIENSPCNDIHWGTVSLGPPKIDPLASPKELFKHLGFLKSLKWLVLAPVKYLDGIHATEMGLFSFGIDKDSARDYPKTVEFFKAQFPERKANQKFIVLADWLSALFFDRVYHALCAVLVLICFALIFTTNKLSTLFLAATCVGTYLLFAYLNHHVPFRYLLEVITPGIFAVFDALANGRLSGARPPEVN